MKHYDRGPRCRRRGMEAVEAAILLPLLLVITLGMIEYGWMFREQEEIVNACRQAARIAATPTATQTGVQNELKTLLSADPTLSSSGYTAAVSTVTVAAGQTVTVTVTVPYSNIQINGPGITAILPLPAKIGGTVAMIKEGS